MFFFAEKILYFCFCFTIFVASSVSSLLTSSPFRLVWNIPSDPCQNKFGVTFNLSQFGFDFNENQQFLGEKISLFYDLGIFPKFFRNSNGTVTSVNGGIPQLGNLTLHLQKVSEDVFFSTKNSFSGLGVIDFESWRAIYIHNFDSLRIYQEASEEEVRRNHPDWSNKTRIKTEAERQFNKAARIFFSATLATVKRLRPKANWGFYHYPYCFPQSKGREQAVCTSTSLQGNSQLGWLFNKSQILLPSLYVGSSQTNFTEKALHIFATIQETVRMNLKKLPFSPYMNIQYEDGGFLDEEDLFNTFGLTFDYGGAGVVIWGSSNDVNSLEKCVALKKYLIETLGPVAEHFHRRLNDCSAVFCGSSYRCQPRFRKRKLRLRKRPFISTFKRFSALSYLMKANPALGRRLFRKEFRCVPW